MCVLLGLRGRDSPLTSQNGWSRYAKEAPSRIRQHAVQWPLEARRRAQTTQRLRGNGSFSVPNIAPCSTQNVTLIRNGIVYFFTIFPTMVQLCARTAKWPRHRCRRDVSHFCHLCMIYRAPEARHRTALPSQWPPLVSEWSVRVSTDRSRLHRPKWDRITSTSIMAMDWSDFGEEVEVILDVSLTATTTTDLWPTATATGPRISAAR